MNPEAELRALDRLWLSLQERLDNLRQEQERIGAKIFRLRREQNKSQSPKKRM